MEVHYQTPNPKIDVFLPTADPADRPNFSFTAESGAGAWSKLQGYSFSESVDDLNGNFSFTIEHGEHNGRSVFDLIPLRSVVRIFEGVYEGGKQQPVFVGIIRSRRISKKMTSQGMRRSIVFSGKSIISCVAEFMISLDVRIYRVATATAKREELRARLIEQKTIMGFIRESWNHFRDVSSNLSVKAGGVANIQILELIRRFLGGVDNFVNVTGSQTSLMHSISTPFYNAKNNHIADVWRNILPQNVYEMFSYCDNDGRARIKVRMVPFSGSDWRDLDIYTIRPISLLSFDLDQNDENVYTVFSSHIVGSVNDRQFYMTLIQHGRDDPRIKYNGPKLEIYGFRPLDIDFLGYDRSNIQDPDEQASTLDSIELLNQLAMNWYSRNDEMYSGSIIVCNDYNNPSNNPKVGCRAAFLGGEFYINKTEHTWTYGATPTIKLSVSRGMVYDENGIMTEIIQDVGSRYKELELPSQAGQGAR